MFDKIRFVHIWRSKWPFETRGDVSALNYCQKSTYSFVNITYTWHVELHSVIFVISNR